jgi:CHAT domain-containing protein
MKNLIREEARRIAKYFHTQPILDSEANKDTLKQRGPSARLIHISCHGKFSDEDPLESGLELADGVFTVRDWLRLRLQADLVTLSACQTGQLRIEGGDNLVGLMRAILTAGAASCVTALWSVDAESTLVWMLEFYRNVWDESGNKIGNKADAFQKATLMLKGIPEYSDPFYWAPYVFVGNLR